MRGANPRVIARNVAGRLRGFELDPFSGWLSTVFFDVTIHQEFGFSDPSLEPVRVCDALDQLEGTDRYDLVIGNPPYGRVRLSAEAREPFSRSLFGHANLYGLFLDLAVSLASPSGVVAYVAPTSFLCGEYYKRLRELLLREAPPVEFNLIHRRTGVFDEVLQETLLAVFSVGAKSRRRVATTHIDFQGQDVTVVSNANARLPASLGRPWIIPRTQDANALVARMSRMPHRLSDWGYRVSTGPLVWNRHKDRLRHRRVRHAVPLIWAEAVAPDGEFRFRAERRNHAPYFSAPSSDDPALVREPCVLLQRTTSKEQPRRLVAAELPQSFLEEYGAVAVENHLNMLVPIEADPPVDPATLAAFLNSEIADRVFRCISGTVAVSAYELEAMPLPPPSSLSNGLPADPAELYR